MSPGYFVQYQKAPALSRRLANSKSVMLTVIFVTTMIWSGGSSRLDLADQLLSHEAARDLEIHDDDVVPVFARPQEVERGVAVGDHLGDHDPVAKRPERVPDAADVVIFVFDEEDLNDRIPRT